MIIVFDKLFTECIHDSELHNRLRENKLRSVLSVLLRNFVEYNELTFQEISKQRNCHFVNYKTELKIIDFFDKYSKKKEVKIFISDYNLYQISIHYIEIRIIVD